MGTGQPTAAHRLVAHLRGSSDLWECLERLADLSLPDCCLGAGCIAQTVWNAAHDKASAADISDHDVVYFDAADLTEHGENEATAMVRNVMADLPLNVDVKNQARVHLWYRRRFDYDIVPYTSIEDAIATWPTTATAIGYGWCRAVLRCWPPTVSTTCWGLWCGQTGFRSRLRFTSARWLDGSATGPT